MFYFIIFNLIFLGVLIVSFTNFYFFNEKHLTMLTGIRTFGGTAIYIIGTTTYFKDTMGFLLLGLMILIFFFIEGIVHIKRQ